MTRQLIHYQIIQAEIAMRMKAIYEKREAVVNSEKRTKEFDFLK